MQKAPIKNLEDPLQCEKNSDTGKLDQNLKNRIWS
jgi:hypothetical protein